jgi:hypothetical protein
MKSIMKKIAMMGMLACMASSNTYTNSYDMCLDDCSKIKGSLKDFSDCNIKCSDANKKNKPKQAPPEGPKHKQAPSKTKWDATANIIS